MVLVGLATSPLNSAEVPMAAGQVNIWMMKSYFVVDQLATSVSPLHDSSQFVSNGLIRVQSGGWVTMGWCANPKALGCENLLEDETFEVDVSELILSSFV